MIASRIGAVLVLLLVAGARASEACSCLSLPVCQAYWGSDAVFLGTVQDVTVVERPLPGGTPGRTNERLVRFVVRRTWKGVAGPIVEISTGMGGGDCGVDFAIGREYIVDAQNRDGRLVTGICDFRSESNAV